ncbi:hypothetical protein [Paenibacillus sp. NFR01]|uniref:hypothetical protein n=1 Tax=Paenibacillus sp. NFR01 TaxID=1566279 RepID=UPI0008ACCCCA|nr:hypothetical protein [Paenibacillus sp. NFR01]SET35251.1 hypothetical protein SAMN03159358_1426 [Paenibacillus sp. NFR01]
MRTEQQIQSKINELTLQKKNLEARLTQLPGDHPQRESLLAQHLRLEDMILMLEWVLDAPTGSYHL